MEAQPETNGPDAPNSATLNGLIIAVLLTGPSVLALIGALTKVDAIAVAGPLGGGLISALIFGSMMAPRFGKTILLKLLVGICCGAVFGFLTVALGFFGCTLGGFNRI